ncbi:MAG: hypothetical protein QXQ14_00190 [Candidatus Aenigmatarchaeota archaeon]
MEELEEISAIINPVFFLKLKLEGEKIYDKIYKNLDAVLSEIQEIGYIDELEALKILGQISL